MGMLDDSARTIIIKANIRLETIENVSKFYHIPRIVVVRYLSGKDNGTLNGRKVIRIEMGRVASEKKGEKGWVVGEKDKYKGGRER